MSSTEVLAQLKKKLSRLNDEAIQKAASKQLVEEERDLLRMAVQASEAEKLELKEKVQHLMVIVEHLSSFAVRSVDKSEAEVVRLLSAAL